MSQTDGEALPELSRISGEPGHYLCRLREIIAERGIAIDNDDLLFGADGVSRGGRISTLYPPRRRQRRHPVDMSIMVR